jgi:hypothetical protein
MSAKKSLTGIKSFKNADEISIDDRLAQYLENAPIPRDQILENLGLFLTSKNLARILFMHHVYQLIVPVPGIVMDFGTRWGQNLSLFSSLRGLYDPFHRHRKLVGFDTFSGFASISPKDGKSDLMRKGNISVTENYTEFLEAVMQAKEDGNPLAHIKKFELVAGDASKTVPKYLKDNPETIVALAYFDFDVYEPTKVCLEAIRPRLVKGSVVCFDELNDPDSPGETIALMETIGLNNISLRRFPYTSRVTYFIVE